MGLWLVPCRSKEGLCRGQPSGSWFLFGVWWWLPTLLTHPGANTLRDEGRSKRTVVKSEAHAHLMISHSSEDLMKESVWVTLSRPWECKDLILTSLKPVAAGEAAAPAQLSCGGGPLPATDPSHRNEPRGWTQEGLAAFWSPWKMVARWGDGAPFEYNEYTLKIIFILFNFSLQLSIRGEIYHSYDVGRKLLKEGAYLWRCQRQAGVQFKTLVTQSRGLAYTREQ